MVLFKLVLWNIYRRIISFFIISQIVTKPKFGLVLIQLFKLSNESTLIFQLQSCTMKWGLGLHELISINLKKKQVYF